MTVLKERSEQDKIQYSEDKDYIIVSLTRAYELQIIKE